MSLGIDSTFYQAQISFTSTHLGKIVRILALDCSGSACSAAIISILGPGEDRVDVQKLEPLRRGHAERIVPMLAECLEAAACSVSDLTAIAATVGPGAFTGIRVGLAAAQGLARASGIPAIGVRVTDAFARRVPAMEGHRLIVALDSRRLDPFCAFFRVREEPDGGLSWRGDPPRPVLLTQEAITAALGSGLETTPLIVGDAAVTISPFLRNSEPFDSNPFCDPADVARVAASSIQDGSSLPPTPLYLRAPDVSDPARDRARMDNPV